ncbi:MAG: hypothetical protein ACOY9Y_07615 [Bacillota bacterium]
MQPQRPRLGAHDPIARMFRGLILASENRGKTIDYYIKAENVNGSVESSFYQVNTYTITSDLNIGDWALGVYDDISIQISSTQERWFYDSETANGWNLNNDTQYVKSPFRTDSGADDWSYLTSAVNATRPTNISTRHKGLDIHGGNKSVYPILSGISAGSGNLSDGTKWAAVAHDRNGDGTTNYFTYYLHLSSVEPVAQTSGNLLMQSTKIGTTSS